MANTPTTAAADLAESVVRKVTPPRLRSELTVVSKASYARIVRDGVTLAYVKTGVVSFTRGDTKEVARLLPRTGKDEWHRKHDGDAGDVARIAKAVAFAAKDDAPCRSRKAAA